jgi:malate dehydrogenase (oxaloacetate-decarboxylating)(NADP+)
MDKLDKEALKYHSEGVPGKVEVNSSKDVSSDYALSLAYSPGVAAPCKEIAKDPIKAFDYTTRGNLVAVITNGTAVLGLGNIGALAGKPVMEGKGVLFKKFANINVFDIEINTQDTEEFISTVKNLEPTFGGINLEDIAAPQCFEIEKRLKKEMGIPVFHDDQHGTAIITAAGLINACHITKRKLSKIKVVFNGAGAAAMSCAQLLVDMGVKKENVLICDSKGVISKSRTDLNEYKEKFAVKTDRKTLKDALKDADVFIGVSVGGAVTEEMIDTMAEEPIVFAMANPEPEIRPELVKKVRPNAIVATGRSDYPNQVNNVLGFPYIFRGALDVRATSITEGMKRAAAYAISELARETVPDEVSEAYQGRSFHFGKDYIIPKPFDQRVLLKVAPAVAQAAVKDGVARQPIKNYKAYREELEAFISAKQEFIRPLINTIRSKNRKTKKKPRILFPETKSRKVLKACEIIVEEGFATPVLMGDPKDIAASAEKHELKRILDLEIIDPRKNQHREKLTQALYKQRRRRGLLLSEAENLIEDIYYQSAMFLNQGLVDGLISGASRNFSSAVKPILDVIGPKENKVIAGLNIFIKNGRYIFMSDTTMKINPTAEELSQISMEAAEVAASYKQKPRIAFLSYTNFKGGAGSPRKMKQAADLVKMQMPHIEIDGEMQADTSVNFDIMTRLFSFSDLKDSANILIFPNLDSANISYKLLQQLSDGEMIGPLLVGTKKPVNIVQRTGGVRDIVNASALVALEVQTQKSKRTYAQG